MDNPLVIDCTNNNTNESFIREIYSVSGQFSRIYKNPAVPYKDMFRSTIGSVFYGLGVLFLTILTGFFKKFDIFSVVLITIASVLLVFALFFAIFFRVSFKKFKGAFNKFEHTVLILDNGGVRVDMDDGNFSVKIPWSEVLALRIYKESFFFFNKDKGKQSIVCEMSHKDQVLAFIGEYGINIRIIQ